jgi:hypothetical protein
VAWCCGAALLGSAACSSPSEDDEAADAAPGARADAAPASADAAPDTPDATTPPPAPDAAPGTPDAGAADASTTPPPDGGTALGPYGCSDLFDQETLGTFEMTISQAEWAKLEDEFLHWAEREEQGLPANPYHPAQVRYQNGPWVTDAMVRLKGQSSWHETVAFDANPRMQFAISFNEMNHDARFHHVRKVELDMPRNDWTFLRQRLATYYLRKSGQNGQCASSAKLVVNGSYYGLFTVLERQDKEYLQRIFPGDGEADGDLWEGARDIKTNEDTFTWTRIIKFWMVTTAAELATLGDLAASVREWAAEAMMNDADGYYGGFHNFYLYDHPTRGFLWLAHDLDATFDFQAADSWPIYWSRAMEPGPQYLMVMADPTWLERYVHELHEAREDYDPVELSHLIDVWSAQIHDAAEADPHRPFSMFQHAGAISYIRQAIRDRATYMDGWLLCRQQGGVDADGDGFDECHDCDDHDAAVHPGAAEVCNALDDDCDGRIDEDDAGGNPMCPSPPAPAP